MSSIGSAARTVQNILLRVPSEPRPLIVEVSRSHSDKPYSAGLLWTGDRPVAEKCTIQNTVAI